MGELNLEKINSQLSRVSIREKKGNLYLRGQFPENGQMVRREIALKVKATKEGLPIALAKAKEIDAQLMLGKWEFEQKEKLTVFKAIESYEKNYWTRLEPTNDRLHAWKMNQYMYFKQLPQDETFNSSFLLKAVTSYPAGSYSQRKFCMLIRPVARLHQIEFNFLPFMSYQQPEINLRELPTIETIIESYNKEKYLPHQWGLGVLATFGLRPHELYRSEFDFNNDPPLVYVGKKTKKKKLRTVFPLIIKELNLFDMPVEWDNLVKNTDLNRTNLQLGQNVTEWFRKYPFTPYQLRHFYAVRGAMEGFSPVVLSKWMGHGLSVHYKHYGSLLGDRESEQLWKQKFTES